MNNFKDMPLRLNMGRVSAGKGDDYLNFTIQDQVSGAQIVDIKITAAEFANLLSARSAHCLGDLRLHGIGKLQAIRKQLVATEEYSFTPERKTEILAAYEIDGWRADREDLGNSHRRTDKAEKGFVVTFRRWEELTPEDFEAARLAEVQQWISQ